MTDKCHPTQHEWQNAVEARLESPNATETMFVCVRCGQVKYKPKADPFHVSRRDWFAGMFAPAVQRIQADLASKNAILYVENLGDKSPLEQTAGYIVDLADALMKELDK